MRLLAFLLPCTMAIAAPLAAQTSAPVSAPVSADLSALLKTAEGAYTKGDYGQAVELYAKAATDAQAQTPPASAALWEALSGWGCSLVWLNRLEEGEARLSTAIAMAPALGKERTEDHATNLLFMGTALKNQKRFDEALPYFQKSFDLSRTLFGAQDKRTAITLNGLAANLRDQGRFAEAEPLYRDVVSIHAKVAGDPARVTREYKLLLADILARQRKYAEAEAVYRTLIGQAQSDDPDSLSPITLRVKLAGQLMNQGRPQDAQPEWDAVFALADSGTNLGRKVGVRLNKAQAQRQQRDFVGARQTLIQAVALLPKDGPSAMGMAGDIDYIQGHIALELGDAAAAEAHFRHMVRMRTEDPVAAPGAAEYALIGLSRALDRLGRLPEAERAARDAMESHVIRKAPQSGLTAEILNQIGVVLVRQNLPDDARPFLTRALKVEQLEHGDADESTIYARVNLAGLLSDQGRYAEAEPQYRKAVEEMIRLKGPKSFDAAHVMHALALNLSDQGRQAESEALYREILAIREAVLSPADPLVGTTLHNLAFVLAAQGRAAEAVPLFERALTYSAASLPPVHESVAVTKNALSETLAGLNRLREAEQVSAEAADVITRLHQRDGGGAAQRQDAVSYNDAAILGSYIITGYMAVRAGEAPTDRTIDRAFLAAQEMIAPGATAAMAQAAVRRAAANDRLGTLIRDQQRLSERSRLLDQQLLAALQTGNAAEASALKARADQTQVDLARTSKAIDRDFPRYRELVSPRPMAINEFSRSLAPDEALLFMVGIEDQNVVTFAVDRKGWDWSFTTLTTGEINAQVSVLRCDADPAACTDQDQIRLNGLPLTKAEAAGHARFDVATAHGLYQELIAPVAPRLAHAKRVYVVTSADLGRLPLALLPVNAPPEGADIADPALLGSMTWFGDRFALTQLPSVSARRLRSLTQSKGSVPFRGYGDPAFKGTPETVTEPATGKRGSGARRLARGGGATNRLTDPAFVAKLPRLPGTRIELEAMAGLYANAGRSLIMGDGATEAAVRRDSELARSRVVVFATHGLLPSARDGMDEPGLAFTPPAIASQSDDGILSASEAAELTLTADFVILSACNTATADGQSGSDSLSALARAFLFSGARSLLASHWEVPDRATAVLTVETLAAHRAGGRTRAQALQAGMRAVRTGRRFDGSPVPDWSSDWAHPGYWAAFTLIANADE